MKGPIMLKRSFRGAILGALVLGSLWGGSAAFAQTKWDMPIAWPPGNFHTKNAIAFAEAVDKATNGQVKITVHPGGALGLKGPESMRAVRDGIVPIAEYSVPQQAGDSPLLTMEALPYLADNFEELRALHEVILPQYDQVFAKYGQKRVYMVPWPNQYLFTKKQIQTPADLKGLKVRTTDRNTSELLKTAGMVPVQMTFADMLPALASGGLDAVTTSASTAVDSRFWEFLKHAYKTNHVWSSNVVAVNLAAWNKLTPQQRTAIEQVARELEAGFWKTSQEDDAKSVAQLAQQGVKVEAAPAPVTAELRRIAHGMWEGFSKQMGEPVPTLIRNYQAKTKK